MYFLLKSSTVTLITVIFSVTDTFLEPDVSMRNDTWQMMSLQLGELRFVKMNLNTSSTINYQHVHWVLCFRIN